MKVKSKKLKVKRGWEKFSLALLGIATAVCVAGCGGNADLGKNVGKDATEDYLLLYLSFDEGQGTVAKDASGHFEDTDINYVFSHASFMESRDPEWRADGVKDGCLLFDGNSMYLNYKKGAIETDGDLSISLWAAPRCFEWDDPNAADNGKGNLTGLVSQCDKAGKLGFELGYERYGRLCFSVGTGTDWVECWTNGDNLTKYAWNQVTATFEKSSGEMKLYLNGELVASRTVPAGTGIEAATNKNLQIGKTNDAERLTAGYINAHSGYIDELKIYNTALSQDVIKQEYDNTAVPEIDFDSIWLQNILTDDINKPQYHGGPYQNWMNEPHAPLYYNGRYHLFYQNNMQGPYWRNICWGHLVSDDAVSWKPIKEAIVPMEGSVVPDGVWSGGATLDANGVPLLFFTAGNDSFTKDGLISNQNIGVAYPADLDDPNLTEWMVCDELAIAQQKGQGRAGEFRDPHIWKEGDTWCMLICSGSTASKGGTALLYETDTLKLQSDGTVAQDWKYIGPVYEMEGQSATFGTSWELPIMIPLTNKAGVTKYFFSISPAPASIADNKIYYFIGDFDVKTGKFRPDEGFELPHLLDYGTNVFTGPSVLHDPISGDWYMFSIMQDQRGAADQGASGWAHNVGLTRKLALNDEGTDVCITPIDEICSLEDEVLLNESDLSVDAVNEKLATVNADMLHIDLTFKINDAKSVGIIFKQGGKRDSSTYYYTADDGLIHGETNNRGDGASSGFASGVVALQDGTIRMDIYIDRSLIEGYFNETKALSLRSYPQDSKGSTHIELTADGNAVIKSIHIATMKSIYQ